MSFWDATVAAILEMTRYVREALVCVVVLESYGTRGSSALKSRDLQRYCGLGDDQCTTTLALLRFMQSACVAFCLQQLSFLTPLKIG